MAHGREEDFNMPDYQAIDADGHVFEPDEMWLEYLDAKFHHIAPRRVIDTQGRIRNHVGGVLQEPIPNGL